MKTFVAAAAVSAVAAVFLAASVPVIHATAADDVVTPGEPGLAYGPLQCNVDASPAIESGECALNAASLSHLVASVAGSSAPHAPVTVPCGTCALVDYTDGSTVTIPGGLNVLGRLHFPSSASVTINTTSVFVQGHLDMGIPDAGKSVKITLYGTEEHFLYPHEQCCDANDTGRRSLSASSCDPDCEHKKAVGKKPFVVAGGQLDIRTVNPACPSWTTLKAVGQIADPEDGTVDVVKNFVVNSTFAQCVRPGDDLIVTSDTIGGWSNHFEWIAESVVDHAEGIVSMEGHTTRAFATEAGPGEREFATEVANLRRDVIFEAQQDDPDVLIGGHLMIFHTPDIEQTIEGVRFENFGQAGNLGRYPIHFHMCGPSPSSVSRNVIINSHQRCVVIHNTNEVHIVDNIAYKTRGHCYVTETGAETDNSFIHNLGAETTTLGRINGQSDSEGSSNPHHNEPSTFWIRNAQNTWIGNVAAGAQVNGWWFEMFNQKNTPLYTFEDNAVHSSGQGLITYPGGGWRPSNDAVLENFRAYKNKGNSRGDGFKFFSSGGFTIKNALIADNQLGIKEFFNSDPIIVQDSRFVGISEDARIRLGKECSLGSGLRFSYNTFKQMQLKNVSFEGYSCGGKAIAPYPELRFGGERMMGEPLGTVEVSLEEGQDPLVADGAWTMYMEDVNGTMSPEGKGPGFFVENTPRLTAFIPESQCSTISGSVNTVFCDDVCLRHMEIFPDNQHASRSSIDYEKLVLTDGSTTFSYSHEDSNSKRHFDVLLPAGDYMGHFEDANGALVHAARGIHIEVRAPPLRSECVYASLSSLTFETNPYPKARFFNYGDSTYLWAADNLDADRSEVGARADKDPAEETVWSIEEVECPLNPLHPIPGKTCFIIVGGGVSRRMMYAVDDRKWTGGVGARRSSSVPDNYKWKLLRTECDEFESKPCVFLINANSGRRLYKHDWKPDFGATPKGTNTGSADWIKWYMEEVDSTPFSSLELDTFAPTPAPSALPSISLAPTATTYEFVNYGAVGKHLWVAEADTYWNGVGADESPTEDTNFVLEEVDCPPNPLRNTPGNTCYNLLGTNSRRVFATDDRREYWTGMGATSNPGEKGKWKLVSAECDSSDPRSCVFITNANNGRKLIKYALSGDFGGTKSVTNAPDNDNTKWYIEDSNGALVIATYPPTPAPTSLPTPVPPASFKFVNFNAVGNKYMWAEESGFWGGVGADEKPTPGDIEFSLERTECPSNPYSIPGNTCYALKGAGARKVFSTTDTRDYKYGMGASTSTRNDGKWKLFSAECDSLDLRTCVFIVNANNGRKLVIDDSSGKFSFGGTLTGKFNNRIENTKWYIEGSQEHISGLDIHTYTPEIYKFVNFGAGGNKYMWAEDSKTAHWNGVGADEDPTHDMVFNLNEVSCPGTWNGVSIPAGACYTLMGGGARMVFSTTDSRTTRRGMGASISNRIDGKWKLVSAECDSSDPRPCVFIVNAYNGRKLVKDAEGNFGGTYRGNFNSDGDRTKWYIEASDEAKSSLAIVNLT